MLATLSKLLHHNSLAATQFTDLKMEELTKRTQKANVWKKEKIIKNIIINLPLYKFYIL